LLQTTCTGNLPTLSLHFPKLGRKVISLTLKNQKNSRKKITSKTRAIYAETIGNPKT